MFNCNGFGFVTEIRLIGVWLKLLSLIMSTPDKFRKCSRLFADYSELSEIEFNIITSIIHKSKGSGLDG